MGLSDHRRIEATLSVADDDQTAARLLEALRALTEHVTDLPRAEPVALPSAPELELEPAMLPGCSSPIPPTPASARSGSSARPASHS
jgi:arginine decarboxylase